MCLWIYQGERCPLSHELPLIYRIKEFSLIFLQHQNFQRDIRSLLLGYSEKDQSQNMLLSVLLHTFIKNSRRFTVGTNPPHHFTYMLSIFSLQYHKFLYAFCTYFPSCSIVRTYVCMVLERTSYNCKIFVQSYCINLKIKYI